MFDKRNAININMQKLNKAQTVNEVNGRKSTPREKFKAARQ